MKKSIFISLIILTLTSFITLNDNLFPDLVKEKLQKYVTKDTPEKIYLHTDKPYYALGEDIWFTGYLVDGVTHKANPKSYIFYVELINEKDSIVSKKKLFTADVTIPGDFKIDKDWNEGTYLLRAYTNYMRNGEPNYFFQKKIPILSPNENKNLKVESVVLNKKQETTILEKPDLSFYPEGGDLVENIKCEVAIKIKNDLYSDMKIMGAIVDDNNVLISQFNTSKFGLGKFVFTPEPNKSYFANIKINGSEYAYPLPKALPSGEVLNIINNGEHIYIKVKSNSPTGLYQTYLIGHQRGQIITEKFESTNTNEYLIKLLTSNLNDGVTHFTLFNASGNPVCERLVFIENKKNAVSVNIQKDKQILGPKEQIKVNLNVEDSEGNTLHSHLSMSVMDLNAFPYDKNSSNIKTWLLLNSDLRGKIKDPGYFLNEENENKRRYLMDIVMLTNGWRRFTWKKILYDEEIKNPFPVEKGIYISGSTRLLKPPYTITPALSRLTFFKPPFEQEPVQKSTDGKFRFGPYAFFDSIPILLESRLVSFTLEGAKYRELSIILDKENKSPNINRVNDENKILDQVKNEAFLRISKYMEEIKREFDQKRQILDEVVITANKKELEDERQKQIRELAYYGEPTHRLDLESGRPVFGVQTAYDLVSRMPGVAAFGGKLTLRGNNPKILMDDFPVDLDFIKTINSDDVSFIDILTGASASMFSNAGGGIIIIYSKNPFSSNSNIKRKPGVIDFTSVGFYTARTFNAPNHLDDGFNDLMKADIRTTLHWEPEIKIDENGSKEISFFTSDAKGEYLIQIEGISKSGLPFHKVETFTVD